MGKIQDWDEMIDTNVRVALCYPRRGAGMIVRARGHVINLGSTAGEMTYPNGAVYCGTKAAERAINDGLRRMCWEPRYASTSVDPEWWRLISAWCASTETRSGPTRSTRESSLGCGRCCRCDCLGRQRPDHVNIARVVLTTVHQANSLSFTGK